MNDNELSEDCKLLIKPINENSKQVLVIGSTKKIL